MITPIRIPKKALENAFHNSINKTIFEDLVLSLSNLLRNYNTCVITITEDYYTNGNPELLNMKDIESFTNASLFDKWIEENIK